MKTISRLMKVCLIGALTSTMPASLSANPGKKPKPVFIRDTNKPANFRAIKAKLQPLKQAGKTAYRNLKATHRSEDVNRQRRQQQEARYVAARDIYTANPTQGNYRTALQLHREYLTAKQSHDSALNAWNAAKKQVNDTWGAQLIELNGVRTQASLPAPKPPRTGAPKMRVQARVQQIRSGAVMAPNARSALQRGGQVMRRDVVAAVQNPQPIGNPAAYPRAAIAKQQAQRRNAQLRQWEKARLDQFSQQQGRAAQTRPAVANNSYFRPGPPDGVYGAPPANVSQVHIYTPAPAAPIQQQRAVIQNQYELPSSQLAQ